MKSTYKIESASSLGTAFLIGVPNPAVPGKAYPYLVTAAHVLESMTADEARITFRRGKGHGFGRILGRIAIRKNGKPLWTTHPEADVAAIPISVPEDADIVLQTIDKLATGRLLAEWDIHPGDELVVLGYPLGAESSDAGFSVLRGGRIASYPILPPEATKTFLLDFPVFEGNSGGPVFLDALLRARGSSTNLGPQRTIVGLISKKVTAEEKFKGLTEIRTTTHSLGLAVVVHAAYIKEAVLAAHRAAGRS